MIQHNLAQQEVLLNWKFSPTIFIVKQKMPEGRFLRVSKIFGGIKNITNVLNLQKKLLLASLIFTVYLSLHFHRTFLYCTMCWCADEHFFLWCRVQDAICQRYRFCEPFCELLCYVWTLRFRECLNCSSETERVNAHSCVNSSSFVPVKNIIKTVTMLERSSSRRRTQSRTSP